MKTTVFITDANVSNKRSQYQKEMLEIKQIEKEQQDFNNIVEWCNIQIEKGIADGKTEIGVTISREEYNKWFYKVIKHLKDLRTIFNQKGYSISWFDNYRINNNSYYKHYEKGRFYISWNDLEIKNTTISLELEGVL